MTNLMRLFQKQSLTRTAITIKQAGQPVSSPANFESYSKEGYQRNVVVYRCINMIAKACSGIEWELYQKSRNGEPTEIEDHPLLVLLDRPNPLQSRTSFFEYLVAYLCTSGNSYIESIRPNDRFPPLELWTVRPDKVKIIPGSKGYPLAYEIGDQSSKVRYEVDQVTLKSAILHMKTFNPTNEWFGQSPLQAAIASLDQSNAANRWNLALLQNSATPSGVLKVDSTDLNPGGTLTTEQFEKLKDQFYESYSGARSAGKAMILEGGVSWQTISQSMHDIEFGSNKKVSATELCTAFGVPPELVGLGEKTFNNYKEARLSFYEDTVLPIMDFLASELNYWLAPQFGEGLKLSYDKDDIEALTEKREQKFTTLQNANWLTQNEKREATGYEPVDGWDVFIINGQALSQPIDNSTLPTQPPAPGGSESVPANQDQNQEIDQNNNEGGAKDFDHSLDFKQINRLNQREKQKTWTRINNRRKSLEGPFAKDLRSDLKKLGEILADAIKGKDPKVAEFAMRKAVSDFMPEITKTVKRHIGYAVNEFGLVFFEEAKSVFGISKPDLEIKSSRTWDYWAKHYIEKRTGDAITQISGATEQQVSRVVKRLAEQAIIDGDTNADIAGELQDEFESLSVARSHLIARTEVGMASSNATLEAAKSLDIPGLKKEWVSVQDARTRDGSTENGHGANHFDMNGVEIDLDEKFLVPPDTSMDGPGDPSAGADQVCNCRCVLVFKSGRGG